MVFSFPQLQMDEKQSKESVSAGKTVKGGSGDGGGGAIVQLEKWPRWWGEWRVYC